MKWLVLFWYSLSVAYNCGSAKEKGSAIGAQGTSTHFEPREDLLCRGTSLIRKRFLLAPYSRPMPGAISQGEGRFLMREVPL